MFGVVPHFMPVKEARRFIYQAHTNPVFSYPFYHTKFIPVKEASPCQYLLKLGLEVPNS